MSGIEALAAIGRATEAPLATGAAVSLAGPIGFIGLIGSAAHRPPFHRRRPAVSSDTRAQGGARPSQTSSSSRTSSGSSAAKTPPARASPRSCVLPRRAGRKASTS